ncbi:group II truncated hemoglobin [Solemya velum gill symbiont]|uniref:group II truncated hemoglobin n=1 Tax=Solemya velum gill symbiont TaxID=2340 RepID=UPI0015C2DB7A|nr:group II truncated hemoglobin [Solemya velum gill symbiont]
MNIQDETPYVLLGGEERVRELVDRFYDYMDELEEVEPVREMHAKSLRVSRDKLFKFLSGWLGGPGLYEAEYGHPRLRRRHMPFTVTEEARDQWLLCMNKAMDDMDIEPKLRTFLDNAFLRTADHMRNQEH